MTDVNAWINLFFCVVGIAYFYVLGAVLYSLFKVIKEKWND